MKTLGERVEALEKKILKLEGGNLAKEDLGNPYKVKSTTKEDIETTPR